MGVCDIGVCEFWGCGVGLCFVLFWGEVEEGESVGGFVKGVWTGEGMLLGLCRWKLKCRVLNVGCWLICQHCSVIVSSFLTNIDIRCGAHSDIAIQFLVLDLLLRLSLDSTVLVIINNLQLSLPRFPYCRLHLTALPTLI